MFISLTNNQSLNTHKLKIERSFKESNYWIL
jgi:hypothetical protein